MPSLFKSDEELDERDKPVKTIRLAVSKDVQLTQLEVDIIDTPEYQRLRKFRQLGTAYLVYPSAQHTRFEHSIGVFSEAKRLMDRIENNPRNTGKMGDISEKQRRVVRLAALLHDVANLPHGHTLEDEINVVDSYQEDEERFENYIGPESTIGRLIEEYLDVEHRKMLMRVLTEDTEPENKFLSDIVKNTVCADLLDYLKRDNYFCGLPLDISSRFLDYLFIHEYNTGEKRLAVRLWKESDDRPRAAIISELVQLLQERYYLAERVYFHHTRRKFSAMLGSAVWYAMNAETNPLTFDEVEQMGDDELVTRLADSSSSAAEKIAKNIQDRRPYRCIYNLQRDDIEHDHQEDRLKYIKENIHGDSEKRAELEQSLCEISGLEKGDIIVYCPSPDMNLKLADMKVTWGDDVIPLRHIDDSVHKEKPKYVVESHKKLWQLEVFIRDGALEGVSLDSESKEKLIEAWCRHFFEGDGLYDAKNMLILDLWEEITNQHGKSGMVFDDFNTLKKSINPERDGGISRGNLKSEMIDIINNQK